MFIHMNNCAIRSVLLHTVISSKDQNFDHSSLEWYLEIWGKWGRKLKDPKNVLKHNEKRQKYDKWLINAIVQSRLKQLYDLICHHFLSFEGLTRGIWRNNCPFSHYVCYLRDYMFSLSFCVSLSRHWPGEFGETTRT